MVKDRFSYQDLRVYEDMIRSFSLAESIASGWDSVHAIIDHFVRASEGALVCLAEACRTRQDAARHEVRQIDVLRLLDHLPRAGFRRIDEAATSIVLNIAEGNGRFAHLDHGRVLQMANRSNTKLAARLEMCALRGAVNREQATELNRLLIRIDQMTARLAEIWQQQ
jgi:four helix bundle protein